MTARGADFTARSSTARSRPIPSNPRIPALLNAAELLGGALLVLGRDGEVRGVNARAMDILDEPRLAESDAGIDLLAERHPELVAWLRRSMAGTSAVPFMLTTYTPTGPHRWTSVVSLAPGSDPQGEGEAAPLWLWRAHDVTAAEQTALALAASEARLRGVLDAGFDAFVIVQAVRDGDGRIADFVIVDVNARAGDMVQRSRDELIGRSLLEVFPLSRSSGLWDQCCTVVITRRPLESMQQVPNPDQQLRWLQRQLVPVAGDAVAISSRDVTEQQLERIALEASELRHRQLFETSGAVFLLVERETGRIIDVNPSAEQFYGWSRATMREMFITDLEAVTLEYWRELTAQLDEGTGGIRLQREHRIARGELRQVEAFVSVVAVAQRTVLHFIVQDITDRVRAERQVRESEARFRAVLSGMREGVVLHDATGAIRVHNPSAERILGLTREQLEGLQPIGYDWQALREDLTPWPTDEHPAFLALRTGESQPRQLMGVRRGAGDIVWLTVTADPLLYPGDSRPYAAVAVFTDVTAVRASEERLRQAQKLEAVAQLAGGLAHDYNNLLTVIRGATGFLREGVGPTSPHLEDLAAIERATERAEDLTRRLLAVGRRQMLRPESVELNQLLRDQLPIMRDELPLSMVVRLELAEMPVLATIDRSYLLDAVRALVDNARASMLQGGVLVLGSSVAEVPHPHDPSADPKPRHFAVLQVTDTGTGMNEEIRRRLFEPFFSTQEFGQSKGMGLASVHGLVHQSRGFIECDTVPGHGTTVRLFFPLAGAPAVSSLTTSGTGDPRAGGVLLVDDDPLLRDLGRRMLEKLGEVVHLAASGPDALDMLAQRADEISAVVTDLTMPGMSGLELITHIDREYPGMPCVAVSGYALDLDARSRLEARHHPFVSKPFNAQALVEALTKARQA